MLRLVGLFLLISLCVTPVFSQQKLCCGRDPNDGTFGDDQYWYLQTPPNTVQECHVAVLDDDEFISPLMQGWAWELNGCLFDDDSFCDVGSSITSDDWCDQDDGEGPPPIFPDDDDDGLGVNRPAFFDENNDVITQICGNSFSLVRTWRSITPCTSPNFFITGTQTIDITDTTDPHLAMPPDFTIECEPVPGDVEEAGEAFGFDICTPVSLSVDTTNTPNACGTVVTREWTVSDSCFTVTDTQTITIQDTTPPTISGPSFLSSSECSSIPDTVSTRPSVGPSSCLFTTNNQATFISEVVIPGSCDQEFTIVRTYGLSDSCGNTAEVEIFVPIMDTTPPVFSPDIPSGQLNIACAEGFTFVDFTASDNCAAVSDIVVVDERVFEDATEADFAVAYQNVIATDPCGNVASRSFTFVFGNEEIASQVRFNPNNVAATKGAPFTLTIQGTNSFCQSNLVLVIDAGAATLQGGSGACFSQTSTGLIYCDNASNTFPLSLRLSVPTDFIPNFLVVSLRVSEETGRQSAVYDDRVVVTFA